MIALRGLTVASDHKRRLSIRTSHRNRQGSLAQIPSKESKLTASYTQNIYQLGQRPAARNDSINVTAPKNLDKPEPTHNSGGTGDLAEQKARVPATTIEHAIKRIKQ